jgi:hypothetical protein
MVPLKYVKCPNKKVSWDSSVIIETGYGLDGPGSIPDSARFPLFSTGSAAHPASYPMGTGGKAAGV